MSVAAEPPAALEFIPPGALVVSSDGCNDDVDDADGGFGAGRSRARSSRRDGGDCVGEDVNDVEPPATNAAAVSAWTAPTTADVPEDNKPTPKSPTADGGSGARKDEKDDDVEVVTVVVAAAEPVPPDVARGGGDSEADAAASGGGGGARSTPEGLAGRDDPPPPAPSVTDESGVEVSVVDVDSPVGEGPRGDVRLRLDGGDDGRLIDRRVTPDARATSSSFDPDASTRKACGADVSGREPVVDAATIAVAARPWPDPITCAPPNALTTAAGGGGGGRGGGAARDEELDRLCVLSDAMTSSSSAYLCCATRPEVNRSEGI